MKFSVIICTHNPRVDYLQRVLDALKAQTLPKQQWELLLIDNASKESLAGHWDLSWHPHSRHILEAELGLTPARLRGIREAKGELLVFVDDDNVLADDYLEVCLQISAEWPRLGAWGGQQFPEFESGPPAEKWKEDFWRGTPTRDLWSNNYDRQATPAGAGVCVRRVVAHEYAVRVTNHPLRLALGRKGGGLSSGEDIDMAFTACDLGLGVAILMRLKLVHLMPPSRVTDDYLIRLTEGFGYSDTILSALRGQAPSEKCRADRLVDFYKRLRLPRIKKLLDAAYQSGRTRAIRELREMQNALGNE